MDKRILLVQDQHVVAPWRHDLERDGYQVSALDWRHALEVGPGLAPDFVLVDVVMPVIDCVPWCEDLYAQCNVSVLVFVDGDQTPPEDTPLLFVTRPIISSRLVERIRKLQSKQSWPQYLSVGDLRLDLENRVLFNGDQRHNLSPKLFELLHMFMTHPGQVLSRKQLMKAVWDTDYLGDTRTLYVHIRWLRKMIEPDASSPARLRTVRGIGYRFDHVK